VSTGCEGGLVTIAVWQKGGLTMAKEGGDALNRLLEAANADESLKSRLLAQPRDVAKQHGVELTDAEAQRLTKLGAFRELAAELRHGAVTRCDPRICYPADVWLRLEATRLIRYFIRYFVFYPADRFRPHGLEERISLNLGLLNRNVRG
jgi:hypothetical protein